MSLLHLLLHVVLAYCICLGPVDLCVSITSVVIQVYNKYEQLGYRLVFNSNLFSFSAKEPAMSFVPGADNWHHDQAVSPYDSVQVASPHDSFQVASPHDSFTV